MLILTIIISLSLPLPLALSLSLSILFTPGVFEVWLLYSLVVTLYKLLITVLADTDKRERKRKRDRDRETETERGGERGRNTTFIVSLIFIVSN